MHWKWGDKLQFKLEDCTRHSVQCWICMLHIASSPMTCFQLAFPCPTADAKFQSGKLITGYVITGHHACSQIIKLSKLVLFSPQIRTKVHFHRNLQLCMYTSIIHFQMLANPSFKPLAQGKLYFTHKIRYEEDTFQSSVEHYWWILTRWKGKAVSCLYVLLIPIWIWCSYSYGCNWA